MTAKESGRRRDNESLALINPAEGAENRTWTTAWRVVAAGPTTRVADPCSLTSDSGRLGPEATAAPAVERCRQCRRPTDVRRRAVLAAGASAALAAAGCAQSTQATPTALPSAGNGPLVFWARRGSELAPRLDNMRPYLVVVYPGGQAIADVTSTLQLSQSDLAALVTRVAGDLAGQPPTAQARGGTRVMDAGLTVLGVRTAAGTRTVTADALDELRGTRAYPTGLYDARDTLNTLADRVTRQGEPYRSDRIRFFAQPAGLDPGTVAVGWPAGVPVPSTLDQYDVRHIDLLGTAAASVEAALRPEPFNWTAVHSPEGDALLVSWRYLLPDE